MADITITMLLNPTPFNEGIAAATAKITVMKNAVATLNSVLAGGKELLFAGGASLLAMVLPTVLAANAVKGFDDNFRRFIAVSGGASSRASLEGMQEQINNLAIKYGEAGDKVAEMAIQFAKAGFTQATIMNELLEPALQLAIANQMDSATAATIATEAWTLWGASVGDFAKMANMMHVAANASLMDVEDLAAAFEYVGSAAVLNNISFEDFLALAGGVSQVAAQLGEGFRSLFINMFVNGEELQNIFSEHGVFQNGKIVLSEFYAALQDATEAQLQASLELWGLRPATNIAQIKLTLSQIASVKDEIVSDTTGLATASDMMRMSIDRLMTSLMESVFAPLRTQTIFDAIGTALASINTTLQSSDIQAMLKDIVESSAIFVSQYGPQLIATVGQALKIFIDMTPTLITLSKIFMGFLDIISKIPAPILFMALYMERVIKLIPQFVRAQMVAQFQADGLTTLTTKWIGVASAVSMAAGAFGLILIAQDPLTKALAAITGALSVLWIYATLTSLGIGGIYVPIVGAIATAGALIAAAAMVWSQPLPSAPATNGYTPLTSSTNATNNTNSTTTNYNGDVIIYGAQTETLQNDLIANGGTI